MKNNVILVGRIVSDPQINETENGSKVCTIIIAISRNFRNKDGIYETDFIPVELYGNIATNTTEYCRKGDVIGVRGIIERLPNEEIKIVAEKISFLTSGK